MKNLINSALIVLFFLSFSVLGNSQSLQERIQCPATIKATTQLNKCGSKVKYVDPFQKITDEEIVSLQCNSSPGTYFETGENTVYYKATDKLNNSYFCIFKVQVVDQQKPFFTSFPSDLSKEAIDKDGTRVFWERPSADDNCGEVHVISSHKSGDFFPVGKTLVTYWVHDTEGNYITKSFKVTVSDDSLSLHAVE
ncbi:MAG: HYR domain-containing protein [Flavobacteriales bacterium]